MGRLRAEQTDPRHGPIPRAGHSPHPSRNGRPECEGSVLRPRVPGARGSAYYVLPTDRYTERFIESEVQTWNPLVPGPGPRTADAQVSPTVDWVRTGSLCGPRADRFRVNPDQLARYSSSAARADQLGRRAERTASTQAGSGVAAISLSTLSTKRTSCPPTRNFAVILR